MRAGARIVASAAVVCGTLAFALGSVGCVHPRAPLVVTDPDPSVKIPAYKQAVRRKDRAAVKQLVKDLDSDDAAVRFYAINALERMTGQRFDYRYYDDEEQRRPAVERWQAWVAAGEKSPRHP
jgi:hypothetical protein